MWVCVWVCGGVWGCVGVCGGFSKTPKDAAQPVYRDGRLLWKVPKKIAKKIVKH